MMCVVNKDFLGGGEDFVRNQLVDGAQFRNVQVLLSQRFLRVATPDEIASARPEDDVDSDTEEAPVVPKRKTGLRAKLARR